MPLFVRSMRSLPTSLLHQQESRVTQWAWGLGLGTSLAVQLTAAFVLGTPIADAKSVPARPAVSPAAPVTSMEAAPAALTTLFQQWDQELSQRKLSSALALYAPAFTHSDGLTRQTLGPAIEQFWQLYPSATYRTKITTWTKTPQGWTVETETQITGRRTDNKRQLALDSLQQLRTTIENGKFIRQEVLGERNRVTSGDAPPTLDMRLDPEVQTNQDFSLDVIVQEPLQNDVLLGAVSDEPVLPGKISDIAKLDLKPLIDSKSGTGPGGIFKIGRAPAKAESRWISAIVLRKTGMTFLTQRIRIVDRPVVKPAAAPKPAK